MNKYDEVIGKCGMYCGVCEVYLSQKNPEWRQRVAEKHGMDVEQVRCYGCGGLSPRCCGFNCEILKCLHEREYEHCYECPNYDTRSCHMFEDLVKKYFERGIDIRSNYEMIQDDKTEDMVNRIERYFACKKCGKLLSTASSVCEYCGAEPDHSH
ncbi:MAG: DUF3795 domain-containing protein [Armatimonadota bacterium]